MAPPLLLRHDMVREGVVVFLGTLARHLPPGDPKRSAVIETLVGVLGTPSEVRHGRGGGVRHRRGGGGGGTGGEGVLGTHSGQGCGTGDGAAGIREKLGCTYSMFMSYIPVPASAHPAHTPPPLRQYSAPSPCACLRSSSPWLPIGSTWRHLLPAYWPC